MRSAPKDTVKLKDNGSCDDARQVPLSACADAPGIPPVDVEARPRVWKKKAMLAPILLC